MCVCVCCGDLMAGRGPAGPLASLNSPDQRALAERLAYISVKYKAGRHHLVYTHVI